MEDGVRAALDADADPWCVRLVGFDARGERRREALMALGDGVLVLRAAPRWALSGERQTRAPPRGPYRRAPERGGGRARPAGEPGALAEPGGRLPAARR